MRVRYGHVLNIVASASRDRSIRFWNLNSDAPVQKLLGHELVVPAIDFSPGRFVLKQIGNARQRVFFLDNSRLVSGSRDNKVIFWDTKTGQILKSIMIGRNLVCCLFRV